MCFWDLLWVGNMKLSQSIQKCMFEILTIGTPYEMTAILVIFKQNLLLKKRHLKTVEDEAKSLCVIHLFMKKQLCTQGFLI